MFNSFLFGLVSVVADLPGKPGTILSISDFVDSGYLPDSLVFCEKDGQKTSVMNKNSRLFLKKLL